MHKGYKFTDEQLAARKRKRKGAWSKRARELHSVRMKERYAQRKKAGLVGTNNVASTNKLTVTERLDIIEHHTKSIRQQLGIA
jgi:hypothetical protein